MTDPLDPDSKPEENILSNDTPPPIEEESAPQPQEGSPSSSGPFFPAMGQGQMSQKDEKFWASLGHLLSLTGIFTGIGYVLGPLVPYLLKKNESPYVDAHSTETLNFSIVTFIAVTVSTLGAVTSLPILGCFAPLIPGVFIVLNLIFCIQGAAAARDGKAYRYPFNWRIIK